MLFDFDGILIDSSAETGFTAYRLLTGKDVRALDELPPVYRRLFSANRCWARKAHEIVEIGRWCLEQGDNDAARLDRDELVRRLTTVRESAGATEQQFFECRMAFVKDLPTAWLGIHQPFEPLWSAVRSLNSPPHILTSKNRAAVVALCNHFDLTIPDANLFTGDNFTSKATNIRALIDRLGHAPAYFVDDCLDNLLEVREIAPEITPILGAWGYSPEEDYPRAAAAGIRAATMEEVISLMQVTAQ